MIRIDLDDKHFTLRVTGHATAEEGKDHQLICNAVSVIAQGLAYSVTRLEKEREAITGLDYRPESGNLLLKIYPEQWAEAAVRKRMQIFGDALEMLAICESSYITMVWNGEEIKGQEEAGNE